MAGYGIQGAVSSVVDNSVKIKRLTDLLPSEEDKALADANKKAEASSLRAELAEQDAAQAQQEADKAQKVYENRNNRLEAMKKNSNGKVPDIILQNETRLLESAAANAKDKYIKARKHARDAQQKASEAQAYRREAINAKINVLESGGKRKKTIFKRLRGGSK